MTNENFKQEFNPNNSARLSETQLTEDYKKRLNNLNKNEQLERIATAAMQGLLSYGAHEVDSHEDIASDAVRQAKALINELNKQL